MNRFSDWQSRLHRFIESRKSEPFVWGKNDCALFVCDAVLDMTGVDMAADVRGKYASEEEAREVLAKRTGGYLADYAAEIARKHGLKKTDWKHLRRGDVGLIETDTGGALGLVLMDGRRLGVPGNEGLETFPVRIAKTGWQVG